jgi:type IV pilus assembly protein PilN
VLAGLSAVAGVTVIVFGYFFLSGQISNQEKRNEFLTQANADLDKKIARIETLKKDRQQLLDRKKVVERLQSNRAESVKIFDQLTRQTPEGLFLAEVNQVDDNVTITGFAQSAARVSTFMRSIADSTVFEHASPNVVDISEATLDGQPVQKFVLTVKVLREQVDDKQGAKDKGKAK